MDYIHLSPSKLNLFQECPLCFWLQEVKGIHRPETPSSTLPRGMDLLIKNYFDEWREQGKLPPEIEGKVEGIPLADTELLKKWRYWKTGPKYVDEKNRFILQGALDECFVEGNYFIPVDYKTRGFDLKEDSLKYYQLQLDCYTLMLEAEGYKTKRFAYLVYYIPQKIYSDGNVKFSVEVYRVTTNPENALKVAREATNLLRGFPPLSHSKCKFCSWGNEFLKLEQGEDIDT